MGHPETWDTLNHGILCAVLTSATNTTLTHRPPCEVIIMIMIVMIIIIIIIIIIIMIIVMIIMMMIFGIWFLLCGDSLCCDFAPNPP